MGQRQANSSEAPGDQIHATRFEWELGRIDRGQRQPLKPPLPSTAAAPSHTYTTAGTYYPSLVVTAPKVRVDVELTGTHTRGMTVGDFRSWQPSENANVTVVLEVEGQRFIDRWMDVLSRT